MNSEKDYNETDKIIWEEMVSSKGNKYYVGHIEEDVPATEDASNKLDFGITCDWYPSEIENWKNTSADFARITGISSYSVNRHDGMYAYIINFENTQHYDYHFYDETGDSYRCNTYINRKHYVRYNSSKPRIVYITGS